jgi:hypothetical protein
MVRDRARGEPEATNSTMVNLRSEKEEGRRKKDGEASRQLNTSSFSLLTSYFC